MADPDINSNQFKNLAGKAIGALQIQPGGVLVNDLENESLIKLRVRDYTEKLDSRRSTKWVLIGLLLTQNLAVYSVIFWALWVNKLADLQVVLGVVVSATLGETYLMVKIMIEWLFKDIDYK